MSAGWPTGGTGVTRDGRTAADDADLDPRSRRILLAGVWLAIAGTVVQTVVHLANIIVLDRRFALLDAESDVSLWAWGSTAAMAGAAAFAAMLGLIVARGRGRLLLLAALLAFLSADDILALHERISIENLGPIPHASRLVWPIVFGPILGLAFLLLGLEARHSPAPIRLVMMAGLAALLVAIAMEVGTPILFALGFDHGSTPYELESVIEEGLELAGVVLLATALAALVVVALRPRAG
jgi:hypothetical protein